MTARTRSTITVLGAGLTGVATALELARQGKQVTLLDQDPRAVNRASLRNEGKIHLGLIYAYDRTLATARLQLEGALNFRTLLRRWIGPRADALPLSTPFVYLVARDSLLSVDQLEQHYAEVESLYLDFIQRGVGSDYLGSRATRLYQRCPPSGLPQVFDADHFIGGFLTQERAVDTDALAVALRDAVAESKNIDFLPEHKVLSVGRANGVVRVEGTNPKGPWCIDSDQVVNALWEHRLAIDQSVGLRPEAGWVHRLKYRVIARLPTRLLGAPSATMVLGPYGDVVVRADGTAYFSWYPLGLRGWSHELVPPESWNAPCAGQLGDNEARVVAGDILGAIDRWYLGAAEAQPLVVDAGAIVAYGRTDVHDAASGLHDRTRVGVRSCDGYYSVDPGKLTTAPLFAKRAAELVLAMDEASA